MRHTYKLTRTLSAPVDAVWQAWTTPDEYAKWANAVPGTVELDVRAGGKWKAVMDTPAGQFPLTGSYLDVADGKRLVIGMDVPGRSEPATMQVDFEEQGDQTGLVVTQACDSEQERVNAEQGTTMLLDGLTAFLAKS